MASNSFSLFQKCFFIIFAAVLINKNASAQAIETYFENYYDDNIYNNTFKVEDFINSFSLNSAYNFESQLNNLQFYYMGNISYYQKNILKSSNSHKFGIVETYLFSEDDSPLNVGLNYTWRNNRENFIVFDFSQLSAYANYKQTISESYYLLAGYIFNKNKYKNLDIFSHNEHKTFIKGIVSLESKTNLTLGLKYDLKSYSSTSTDSAAADVNSQFGIFTNISQSIDDYTVISGYISYKKNLIDGTRYLSSNDLIYYEEEIFNDLYSNSGYEFGISLSKYFSEVVLTKAEISYIKKDFPNIPVPDAEGYDTDIKRKDNQFTGAFSVEFYLGSIINGLSLELTWNYINNNSNDPFYNYDNNLASVSFNWGL